MQPDFELQHSRTLLLPGLELEQLEALARSEVWVIGLGGLGAAASLYLASAGVGQLHLVDGDLVSISNLPRQVLYGMRDVGRLKVEVAAERLRQQYPSIEVATHGEHATAAWLEAHLGTAALVMDCTDRFASRHAINQYCVQHQIALVIASVVRWEGQLMVCSPRLREKGCYACSFPPSDDSSHAAVDAACGAFGVFPTMAGLMAILQAQEGLKVLMGLEAEPDLLLVQGPQIEVSRFKRLRMPACPVCSEGAARA